MIIMIYNFPTLWLVYALDSKICTDRIPSNRENFQNVIFLDILWTSFLMNHWSSCRLINITPVTHSLSYLGKYPSAEWISLQGRTDQPCCTKSEPEVDEATSESCTCRSACWCHQGQWWRKYCWWYVSCRLFVHEQNKDGWMTFRKGSSEGSGTWFPGCLLRFPLCFVRKWSVILVMW